MFSSNLQQGNIRSHLLQMVVLHSVSRLGLSFKRPIVIKGLCIRASPRNQPPSHPFHYQVITISHSSVALQLSFSLFTDNLSFPFWLNCLSLRQLPNKCILSVTFTLYISKAPWYFPPASHFGCLSFKNQTLNSYVDNAVPPWPLLADAKSLLSQSFMFILDVGDV